MANNTVVFPVQEFAAGAGHTIGLGGMSMEVKHTHPEHESREARLERLKDVQKNCMALIRMLRGSEEKSA